MSQKITPNLWFDGNAKEAVEFYTATFPNSQITSTEYYPKSTDEGLADFQQDLAGNVLTVEFELNGQAFVAINAGPEFKPNPSVSFMVNLDPSRDYQAEKHLDEIWNKLTDGGQILMPLDSYSFSKHYGWVQDKFGFSWQLILTNPDGEERPYILPELMFTKDKSNRAKEAIDYYTSVFDNSKVGMLAPYGEAASGDLKPESLMFADFCLDGQWFVAMDGGAEHDFAFNEAVSFAVTCKDQAEIDYFWEKLSSVPEAEQCGWCKDKFGVSWQIVPANMGELMQRPDAFKHMMAMHKIVINDF